MSLWKVLFRLSPQNNLDNKSHDKTFVITFFLLSNKFIKNASQYLIVEKVLKNTTNLSLFPFFNESYIVNKLKNISSFQ